MQGVLAFRPWRVRRAAVLAGVALAAAGSVVGGAQAHAVGGAVPVSDLGNGQGTLVVSPASGPTNGAFTVSSPACPSTADGSAKLLIADPLNPTKSTSLLGIALRPSAFTVNVQAGTLNRDVIAALYDNIAGDTAEIIVECYPGSVLSRGGVYENDAFLSISANGSAYTQVPNPAHGSSSATSVSGSSSPTSVGGSSSPSSVGVTLTASPNPATSGQSVTLTATVTP